MSNYRQGDVALFKIKEALADTLKVKNDCILARGEATGATHELIGGIVYEDEEGNMYVQVDEEGQLIHNQGFGEDNHNTLTIEKGTYKVNIERDYYNRRVID